MKHQKSRFLTLTFASLLGAAAFCGGAVAAFADDSSTGTATASTAKYSVSSVFTTDKFDDKSDYVSFSLKNNGSATLSKRDVAWKWFTAADADPSYLNFKLQFADKNFATITVNLETATATANEDNIAVNKLVFTNVNGTVYASVNDADPATEGVAINVENNNVIQVRVDQKGSLALGEYNVYVDDGAVQDPYVGRFTNVGAAYGEYSSSGTKITPFKITATLPETQGDAVADPTVVRLMELNGQSFALTEGQIVDNAAPVLVVNDDIQSIMLGTAFAVDFDYVDVLETNLQKKIEYAQYKPGAELSYKDISTSYSTTYFYDTQYEKDGKLTSVWEQEGKEYLSVRVSISDKFFKDDTKAVYDMAWYASKTAEKDGKDYIILDRNEEGATYTFLDAVADTDASGNELKTGENKLNDPTNKIEAYKDLVKEAAKDLKAGSKTNFYLPSLVGYITDNGGYTNLKFTISYRSDNSTSASTRSSLSYSNLQFPVAKSGVYQFKVFAVDKAGNQMMYYNKDGKLVPVSSSNVWDIEEIPYFEFEIPETSLSIEDNASKDTDRRDSVAVGKTFDDFDLNVLGDNASTTKIESKLYRIDLAKFTKAFPNANLSDKTLAAITYDKIQEAWAKMAAAKDENGKTGYEKITDHVDAYLNVYADLLADKLDGVDGIEGADLLNAGVFVEIEAYNDKITEENHAEEFKKNNAYHWDPEKRSFVAQSENDVYFVLAVYTDSQIESLKACGYKVVTVDAEDDVMPGETEWLKNNIVSVILFGVAGLMLVLIVIVLLIKPSDETLEDVEENAKKKAKKSKKVSE